MKPLFIGLAASLFGLSALTQAQSPAPVFNCDDQAMRVADSFVPGEKTVLESLSNSSQGNLFSSKSLQFSTRAALPSTVTIPVVVHVFGKVWPYKGAAVTDEIIEEALNKTNEDFKGLNDDFNTVDDDFISIASTLDIEFKLAKLDPNGKPTTGVNYYPNDPGRYLGNVGGAYSSDVKKYAWDNYKYMNLYIALDYENSGNDNNSGVAWYPSKDMSDENVARVVYNGRYLYRNTDKEFASVLTHEFGHWLGLAHTFEGGCEASHSSDGRDDDGIADTPSCRSGQGCRNVLNCKGEEINGENYMDYNASCYKMFTIEQVERMNSALFHDARRPLWQESNLIATGLSGEPKNTDPTEESEPEEVEEPAVYAPLLSIVKTTNEHVFLSWTYILVKEKTDPVTGDVLVDDFGEPLLEEEIIFDRTLVKEYQLYQDGELIQTIANNKEATATTFTIENLKLHQNYQFKVVAIAETGETSPDSQTVTARTHALNSDLGRELDRADEGSQSSGGSLAWILACFLPLLYRRRF